MDWVLFDADCGYLGQWGQNLLAWREDESLLRIRVYLDFRGGFLNKIMAIPRFRPTFKYLGWRDGTFKASNGPPIGVKMRVCQSLLHFLAKSVLLSKVLGWAKSANPVVSSVKSCLKYLFDLSLICKLSVKLLCDCQIVRFLAFIQFTSNRFSDFNGTLNLMRPFSCVKIVFHESSLVTSLCQRLMKFSSLELFIPTSLGSSLVEFKDLDLPSMARRNFLCTDYRRTVWCSLLRIIRPLSEHRVCCHYHKGILYQVVWRLEPRFGVFRSSNYVLD